MKSKGFTLIELMIVVAIIAIIAAIAIPNLLRSRMAANETAAVAACKAFATAEDIYRRTDYNKDGILEYAQALSGANSLYETTGGTGDLALVDRSFANAEGQPLSTATPKAGYVFAVLTSAGANASGGARTFIDGNGSMTLGYGLSAVSNQYDGVGRNTFVVSNSGTIYEIDRGSGTTNHETLFDPSSLWVIAE
jgi:prepilin-type N-terminal cleavage/methylation domain-containing protein